MLRDVPKDLLAVTSRYYPKNTWSIGGSAVESLFLFLVLYFTLPAIAGWVVKDWMPAILKSRFHLTQGAAGVYATVYVNIAALCGAFLGGYLATSGCAQLFAGALRISALGMCHVGPRAAWELVMHHRLQSSWAS